MLNIPFLDKFIGKALKEQLAGDAVDYMNYYVTSLILAFFSLLISAKQYFGSPIQCWVPNEFKGGWEKYAEDICFISHMYHIPMEEDIPSSAEARQDQISYYRWVPILLALQAVMFFLPNYLWNMLHKQTAINPRSFVRDAEKLKFLSGTKREEELTTLANYFMETVSIFGTASHRAQDKKMVSIAPRSGYNAMLLYLLTKAFYVTNIFLQIVILNHFLGENFLTWGYEMTTSVLHGEEWSGTPVFPRVILCDFTVRRLANLQKHTVQCVIMINMINEKLYLFLYFWFLMLAVVTLINFCYYLVTMLIPSMRVRLILRNTDYDRAHRHALSRFSSECLHPDGVLLLQFVRQHAGGRVAFDLTNRLIALYANDTISSSEGSSMINESGNKYEKPPRYSNNHHNFGSPSEKKGFYPDVSARAVESAPLVENDYTKDATMRLREPRKDARSPTDV